MPLCVVQLLFFFNSITSDREQIKWTAKFSSPRIKHRHEYKIIFHGILSNEVIRENIRKLIIEHLYEYIMCLNTHAHHIQKWFLQYLVGKTIFHLTYISYIPYVYNLYYTYIIISIRIWICINISSLITRYDYLDYISKSEIRTNKQQIISCKQIFATKSTKNKTVYNK